MAVRSDEIASISKGEIETFGTQVQQSDVGTVIEVHDGIARHLEARGFASLAELPRYLPRD